MTFRPTRRLVPAAAVDAVSRSRVGVVLPDVVPTCLMVERAAKHGALFLLEMMLRVRIGLVQHGLVGLSLSLFALLLISVAEPLGLALFYAVSAGAGAGAVWAQASFYALSVVRRPCLAGVLGTLFTFPLRRAQPGQLRAETPGLS